MVEASGGAIGLYGAIDTSSDKKHYVNYILHPQYPHPPYLHPNAPYPPNHLESSHVVPS